MRPTENYAVFNALGNEVRHSRVSAERIRDELAALAQLDGTAVARAELAKVRLSVALVLPIAGS